MTTVSAQVPTSGSTARTAQPALRAAGTTPVAVPQTTTVAKQAEPMVGGTSIAPAKTVPIAEVKPVSEPKTAGGQSAPRTGGQGSYSSYALGIYIIVLAILQIVLVWILPCISRTLAIICTVLAVLFLLAGIVSFWWSYRSVAVVAPVAPIVTTGAVIAPAVV